MNEVRKNEQPVDISTDAGYVAYPQRYTSLATIINDIADEDTVEVIWGEGPIPQNRRWIGNTGKYASVPLWHLPHTRSMHALPIAV